MRTTAFSVLALGLGAIGGAVVACGTSSDDCAATATCGPTGGSSGSGNAGKSGGGQEAGDGGGGSSSGGAQNVSGTSGAGTSGNSGAMGGGGEGGATGCSGDVADDAACWTTDELGVFVSSDNGKDDTGDGTRANPFATITHAIASASGKNIYVCAGAAQYNEQILVNATTDGLRIYGGFDCDDWSYKTDRNSSVVSPEPIALRIQSLKKGIYIENLWFQAADGNDKSVAGASSYGAYVTGSKGVVFKRVKLMSGAGAKGKDQVAAGPGMNGAVAGTAPKGDDGICTAPPKVPTGGSWGGVDFCSLGGDGGSGHKNTGNGQSGTLGSPTTHIEAGDIENGGPGATGAGAGENGKDGKVGLAGNPGSAAAASGSFLVGGFTPASGNAGADGWPGQGGGGGGASKGTDGCYGASGGAGGMGGCGGHPGVGGGGGGASVALITWASEVSLTECTLTSAAGGAGGKGGDGGAGGIGAAGGTYGAQVAATVARGGSGGVGGDGGPGGSGSGGSGGPSYAIAWNGTQPTQDAATALTAGAGGAKGAGGKGAPAGSAGASELVFPIP